jgi:hypothetical protein
MSLHHLLRPREGGVWRTVREEVWEVVWLISIVGALSVASVALAVMLAGARFNIGTP